MPLLRRDDEPGGGRGPTEVETDSRNIITRRRGGVVFKVTYSDHYKFYKNPLYRCSIDWNNLEVRTSLIEEQIEFKNTVKKSIPNPYAKVL